MKEWYTEVREAAQNTAALTAGNQMVLGYQFERARLAHPEGFTMDLYGRVVKPTQGYAVGMTPISFDNPSEALETLAAIQSQWGFRNLNLGYWKDDQDGHEYIDVVMVTSSREMAERLGRINAQKAIWDFGASQEIRLDTEEVPA